MPDDGAAVAGRGEEPASAGLACADELLLDAADRPDRAVRVDRAGAGDGLPAGQVARGEDVDDAEGEHHPGARPADVLDLDLDLEREPEHRVEEHPEHGAPVVPPGGPGLDVALDAGPGDPDGHRLAG